jgi:hypothetical protein
MSNNSGNSILALIGRNIGLGILFAPGKGLKN